MLLVIKQQVCRYEGWLTEEIFQGVNSIVDLAFTDEWLVSTRER
jgi:hypothetical protein